ncbi:MAG: glycosyltransferase family 2 protein, partial [Acidimicrobiales bacterium]
MQTRSPNTLWPVSSADTTTSKPTCDPAPYPCRSPEALDVPVCTGRRSGWDTRPAVGWLTIQASCAGGGTSWVEGPPCPRAQARPLAGWSIATGAAPRRFTRSIGRRRSRPRLIRGRTHRGSRLGSRSEAGPSTSPASSRRPRGPTQRSRGVRPVAFRQTDVGRKAGGGTFGRWLSRLVCPRCTTERAGEGAAEALEPMTASSSGSSAHVAVIIPTRDRAALLQRALATVEQQRGADVEVIVVDDGSADAASVAAACEAHPCVRLVRRESGGNVSAARNAGIAATAAPWLAFLDDDDVWAPGKLERQLAAARAHAEAPWVVCGEVGFGPEREMLWVTPAVEGLDYGRELLGGNVVPGGASGVVARTAVVRRLGGFDEQLANFADWDLWIRL